jgi:hypothetical protein
MPVQRRRGRGSVLCGNMRRACDACLGSGEGAVVLVMMSRGRRRRLRLGLMVMVMVMVTVIVGRWRRRWSLRRVLRGCVPWVHGTEFLSAEWHPWLKRPPCPGRLTWAPRARASEPVLGANLRNQATQPSWSLGPKQGALSLWCATGAGRS